MKIGSWSKGIDTVEVDGVIKALLIHHDGEMTLWEYDAARGMTTGKDFGIVTMDQVESRYGELDKAPAEPNTKEIVFKTGRGSSEILRTLKHFHQEHLDL